MNPSCVVLVAGAPIEDQNWLKRELKGYATPYIIGVDRGALLLCELGFSLDEAVGDFDSVNDEEFKRIQQTASKVTKLPSEKDLTDLEEALSHITSNSTFNKLPVYLYGALGSGGGRLDHLLHNITLFRSESFTPLLSRVKLIEQEQEVLVFKPGTHIISYEPRWRYFGVFTLNEVNQLEIQQAKYTLEATNTSGLTSWISNEFLPGKDVCIQFQTGIVFVVLTALN